MTELPVSKVCARCGESFYCMPSRLSKTPGTGLLCRRCRMAALDAMTSDNVGAKRGGSDRHGAVPSQVYPGPATGSRLYPCRICGAHSVNRFYCPDHHQQITLENGPFAEDFGFGSEEGVASRATFLERVDSPPSDA